jgi:hypothetical protein
MLAHHHAAMAVESLAAEVVQLRPSPKTFVPSNQIGAAWNGV